MGPPASHAAGILDPADLARLSIEELTAVEITAVSRRPQSLASAPAAAFVIRGDDIRRAGALTLPEALRLAPNLHVARVETRGYAISARGFNGSETSNKLQVLIDGRSVYSLLQSGVFWDAQSVFLPDLDRIEVVSGPGGTLWGSNAVNGVINIVTKPAHETQGGLVDLVLGTDTRRVGARYGGLIGDRAAFRLNIQGVDQERPDRVGGIDTRDDWDGIQGNFRVDLAGEADSITLQGDAYDLSTGFRVPGQEPLGWGLEGESLAVHWSRTMPGNGVVDLRGFVDISRRNYLGILQEVKTYALEAQHVFSLGSRHRVVWGGGQRWIRDDFRNTLNAFVLDPRQRWLSLSNLFVQDEIALAPDLDLMLGLKLERSSFTGIEYLPNARLAWQLPEGPLLWAAVSRAVRTPSRIDRELVAPGILVKGDFQSEKLVAVEAGYRGSLSARASLSVSAFLNFYDDIRTTEPGPTGGLPLSLRNGIKGETWGVEAWGDYAVRDWWRVSAGLTVLRKDFEVKPGRVDLAGRSSTGNDPDWHGQIRSRMTLAPDLDLDLAVRMVDDLPRPSLPGYTLVDMRLGWQVSRTLALSLAADNLLDDRHTEMTAPPAPRIFGRSVHVRAQWSF